jgi:hypothetical protein
MLTREKAEMKKRIIAMDSIQEYDFSKLRNLESIKDFCDTHLFDIATGGLRTKKHSIKVRYIDFYGKFGYTGLGRFFFVDDSMYIITKDKKYESDHNSAILDFDEDLDILKYTGENIVRVLYAGIFTGFYDENEVRIFTGDIVKARVLLNPTIPSNGGRNRARNHNSDDKGSYYEAGVSETLGDYSIIFDNHSVPQSWATELEIIGSLFYDLRKDETEIDIGGLCSNFAQSQTDINELKKLIKKSPYFKPVTWQDQALDLLCGPDDENC